MQTWDDGSEKSIQRSILRRGTLRNHRQIGWISWAWEEIQGSCQRKTLGYSKDLTWRYDSCEGMHTESKKPMPNLVLTHMEGTFCKIKRINSQTKRVHWRARERKVKRRRWTGRTRIRSKDQRLEKFWSGNSTIELSRRWGKQKTIRLWNWANIWINRGSWDTHLNWKVRVELLTDTLYVWYPRTPGNDQKAQCINWS